MLQNCPKWCPICQFSSKYNQWKIKLGSFFIICKPKFQVPNKTLECLFNLFLNNLDGSKNQSKFCFGPILFLQKKVQFISYTIVLFCSSSTVVTTVLEEQNSNFKFYLVVRQFIIYGLSSRAPGFQYSSQWLVSESLKEMTDSDTSPFGDKALSMKENLTFFVPGY